MKRTQLGVSATADFEDNTWTFEMPESFTVTAGTFAIVPVEQFNAALNNLETIIANFPLDAGMQSMKDNLISIINLLEQ